MIFFEGRKREISMYEFKNYICGSTKDLSLKSEVKIVLILAGNLFSSLCSFLCLCSSLPSFSFDLVRL